MQTAEIRPMGNCRVSCSLLDKMAAPGLEETSTDKSRGLSGELLLAERNAEGNLKHQ